MNLLVIAIVFLIDRTSAFLVTWLLEQLIRAVRVIRVLITKKGKPKLTYLFIVNGLC